MSVFHLKYRPSKISELDLGDVAEKLKKFLEAKEIPQSFLFSGPKGAGKTSAARILAKVINCQNRKDGEACEVCDNCKEITQGRAMDIIEMDAASNRGIEDVRSLKDKAYLSPSKLTYKVFIIDEVHMLTKDAFNALLKLIEEPPKHTIFILCTTDAEKIPDTVMSRLIRVDFRRGSKEELKKSLEKIIKGEGIKLTDESRDFIVERSDGSFRNLQKNFNEMVLALGNELTVEQVEKFYLSRSGDYNEVDFEKDLLAGEIKLVLEKIEKMANDGIDFVEFRQELLRYFQQKILISFGVVKGEKSDFPLRELESLINLLIRAAKQEKETEIDQLPLELAVIDFLSERKNPVEVKKNDEITKEVENVVKDQEKKAESAEIGIKEEVSEPVVCEEPLTVEVTGLSLEKVEHEWGNILLAVKPFNHSVEAFLRASRPVKIKGRNLVLEVFYPFHKDRLEEPRNRKIVEDGLQKVLGVELVFECVLGKSKKEPLVIQNNTPMESVSENLAQEEKKETKQDIYDVAKDIFG